MDEAARGGRAQRRPGVTGVHPTLIEYCAALLVALRGVLGERLVGAWVIGSAGAGVYEPGISDIDVTVGASGPLENEVRRRLAAELSHAALPCPARKLELVVYTRAVLAAPERLAFELNLNTGASEPDHITFDIAHESPHWFLLDLAIAREASVALSGPPLATLLGPIPRSASLAALRLSLDWFEANEPDRASVLLAACRAWRFAEEGVWGTKPEAAEWAASHRCLRPIVERALRLRRGEQAERLGSDEVAEFVSRARAALG
jgi:Domain of unknown function (DUF4111)